MALNTFTVYSEQLNPRTFAFLAACVEAFKLNHQIFGLAPWGGPSVYLTKKGSQRIMNMP